MRPTRVVRTRKLQLLAAAALLPVALMTFYLIISRAADIRTSELADTAALVIACGVGAAALWQVVGHIRWRLPLLAAYVLAMGTAKFAFSQAFVCSAFGDCV